MSRLKYPLQNQYFAEEDPKDGEETPITPEVWFDNLVTDNKDDIDFVKNATEIKKMFTNTANTELETAVETLKAENAKLKEDYFAAFMGIPKDVKDKKDIKVEEAKPNRRISDII